MEFLDEMDYCEALAEKHLRAHVDEHPAMFANRVAALAKAFAEERATCHPSCVEARIVATLTTDAGTGWVSPEDAAKLWAVVDAAQKYALRSGVHPDAQPEVHQARDGLLAALSALATSLPARPPVKP